jgi:DNA replication and repair protein RecF
VSLRVTRLTLKDFRSYESLELTPGEKITVIVGPNAVGKTNIIEALELLTAASSFRGPQWAECVRWGAPEASLELEAEGDNRKLDTRLRISSEGKRNYSVNGNPKRKIGEVTGALPCVVFTPDDLKMVKESAERRRSAIDSVGDQLSRGYLSLRGEYERTVRQRNAALKNPSADPGVLTALTQRLTDRGTAFLVHRRRLFGRLSANLAVAYSMLVQGESLEAVYEPSWLRRGVADEATAFEDTIEIVAAEERARGVTLVGPHRDDIRFLLNGRDARIYASQGQQRTISLAWKLAEVSVITDVGGQPPVLLLDDVMSELDESRRHALASFMGEVAQTFVTTTNIGYFETGMIRDAQVVSL